MSTDKMTTYDKDLARGRLMSAEPGTPAVEPGPEFESHIPYMASGDKRFTAQEQRFIALVVSGMSLSAAGRAAGYTSRQGAWNAANRPEIKQAIEYFQGKLQEEVEFNVRHAHGMYMEAWAASANATEMRSTVDSLVKLHKLVGPETAVQVNVDLSNVKSLERMSDEQLIKLAGAELTSLEPESGDE